MGRSRSGGGVRPRSSSRFGRNLRRNIKCVMQKDKYANVDQLVDHLRSTYPQYARLELQPFTKYVHQILHSSRKANDGFFDDSNSHEQKEANPRKKRKELEEKPVKRRRNDAGFGHSAGFSSSSASYSSGSIDSSEDEGTTYSGDGNDLMKSMLRENYRATSKTVELEVVGNSLLGKTANSVDQKGGEDFMKFRKGKGGSETNGPMFKDLGGMDKVIRQIKREVMVPLYNAEVLRESGLEPIAGILLHGTTGCGKTMLAHVIGNEARVPFYNISATELVSGVSGESEENIRGLFSKARRNAASIIFIDEIDAIASKKDNVQREMERRIVAQLMTCMDESYRHAQPADRGEDSESSASSSGYVLVIGATNRLNAIDPALRRPGRFDLEICLGVPDEEARGQILTVCTRNFKLDGALDLKQVARSTPGFVGVDLLALVNKARMLALSRVTDQNEDVLSREWGEDWWRHLWSHEDVKNLILTMADFEEAAKMVQPSTKREGFSVLPNVKWDDVGGLHSLKQELDFNIVKRIKYPEDYEEFGLSLETGILLYGPPGCGKTLIAQAVASEAGASLIYIKGPELLNKYVGETETSVREIFSRARTCTPCIIFFDEVDVLTRSRGTEGGWVVEGPLAQLLVELDGLERRRGVHVIGATNRPDAIDKALLRPRRFSKLLYVPLPSPEERGMILRSLAGKRKIDATVDLRTIGKDSSFENFSGADLFELMEEAASAAMKDKQASSLGSSVDGSVWTIKNEHFKIASKKILPSVSEKQIRDYSCLPRRFKCGLD